MTNTTFICLICNNEYTKRCKLLDHYNTHLNIKQNKCTVCYKSFNKKGHLTVHMKRHQDEKIECVKCKKMYSNKNNYDRHVLFFHS